MPEEMKKIILLFSLNLLLSGFLFSNPNEKFQEGTAAYQNKDYKAAIAAFEGLVQKGMESKELYYNLGNSYYQEKQLGKAVLFLERSLQLAPRDADIQHNLKVIRQELQDDIEELPPFFLAKWWKGLSNVFGSGLWSILAILTMWLAIGGLVLWLRGHERSQKKKGFLAGMALLVLSFLFFALGNTKATIEKDSGHAILMPQEIALRSAPDADSKVIVALHEGTKVAIQDQISDWYKVRLANGEVGWLPINSMEKI